MARKKYVPPQDIIETYIANKTIPGLCQTNEVVEYIKSDPAESSDLCFRCKSTGKVVFRGNLDGLEIYNPDQSPETESITINQE
jgi:hypothetical protein